MILVEVRCYRCNRILGSVEAPPDDWSGIFSVVRCRKCDIPDPSRMASVLISSGRDSFGLTGEIPWEMLQPSIRQAQRSGKTQEFKVRVVEPHRSAE